EAVTVVGAVVVRDLRVGRRHAVLVTDDERSATNSADGVVLDQGTHLGRQRREHGEGPAAEVVGEVVGKRRSGGGGRDLPAHTGDRLQAARGRGSRAGLAAARRGRRAVVEVAKRWRLGPAAASE